MKNYRPNRFVITALSLFILSLVTLFYQSDTALTKSNLAAVFAPITVTKSTPTLTTDVNGNGVVNAGDTLTYSITVANGATDATGVIFTDALNLNLTLVPNSVNSSPIAKNESYNVLGNVKIDVPAANGVKINDTDPDGTTPAITGFGNSLANANATAAGNAGTSAQSGNVTLNTDGSFSYNPPAGFEGTDSFFYTLRDAGADGVAGNADDATDTTQVTLNIADMIWFVNNASASCTTRVSGCGRLNNPYSSLAAFQAESTGTGNNPATGDSIFIYTGSGNYDASVTLLNNQRLIGQGANTALTGAGSITGLTVPSFSATLPATGGTNPTLITTAPAANAVNLGQNNTLRGITIGNTTGAKLNAAATVGTATIGSPSGASDVTLNGNGQAINLTGGGTLAARFASISTTNANQAATATGITLTGIGGSLVSPTTTITNPNGIGINVGNSASGANFDFGNTTVNQSGNTGVSLTSNAGTITFANLDIAPDSAQRGLLATSNTGGITVTSGTITAATNTAVEVSGASAASTTPINMTLTTVSSASSAAPNGIILSNTSGTGFSIVGTGGTCTSAATCTGGTIANKTGADGSTTQGTGIYLSNVVNVSLTRMQLNDFQNFAIRGESVNNFTMRDSNVSGISGTTTAADEGALRFGTGATSTGIKGTALFEGNTIGGGLEDNLGIFVFGSDTLTLNVNDNATSGAQAIFNNNDTTNGSDALLVNSGGTSNITVTIDGVTFNGSRGDLLQTLAEGSTTQNTTVKNNTFANMHPNIITGGGGIALTGSGTGINVTYRVDNNTFKGMRASPIYSMFGGVSGTIKGVVTNNTIGTPNGAHDTSQANRGSQEGMGFFGGIDSKQPGNNSLTYALRIEGNTFRDIDGAAGILLRSNSQDNQGICRVEATIKSNTFAEVGNIAAAIYAQPGGASLNNDLGRMGLDIISNTMNVSGSAGADAVVIDQASAIAQIYLPGYAGPSAPTTQVSTFLLGKSNTWTLPASNSGTGGAYANANNVTGANFVLTVPSFALRAAAENKITDNTDNNLGFFNTSYHSPSEMLASIQPFVKHSTDAEIAANVEIANAETAIEATETASPSETINSPQISYRAKVSAFVSDASNAIIEFAGKVGATITPTVIAHEAIRESKQKQTKGDLLTAPESGETVCVDGNTDTTSCAGGFSIPATESTTITFRAVVNANSTATSIPNTASAGGVNSNTVTTTIVQPPSVSKDFVATFISIGGTTSLNFTITNPNPSTQLTGVSLTDVLPAGLSVTGATSSACGGTNNLIVTAASRTIQLSGGTIAAAGNCQFSVTVTGAAEGLQNNVTGNVSSTNGGQGNTATDTVTVIRPPTLAKSFTPNQIQLNATSSLQFTLANPNSSLTLNTLAFSDSLPAGVTAPNTAATTICTDASYSITANVISFTKPSLAAGTNCVFSVTVTGTTVGVKMNQTSTVTTANSNAGTAATANLTVIAPPTIGKTFAPTSIVAGGTSVVTLTLTNSNTTGALTNASFTDTLVNMNALGGAVTGTCAGTSPNTLAAGATALSFGGITIPNNGSCTVIFSVTSATVGVQPNSTSGVTTAQTATAGQVSNTANLTVIAPTDLTVVKTHTGSFTQGDTAKTYSITVTNSGGTASSGTVTVVDTLPTGLTATAISGGASWTCTLATLTCTRSDVLAASASYPAITLTVNVANNAPSSVTNSATVSGGGETNTTNNTATDPTTVNPAATYSISGQVTNGGEGLSGVSVALSGASSSTVTTDAAGNYSFSSLAGSVNYTVTPTLNGYTFNPINTAVNNLTGNQTAVNFATSTVSYEGDVVTRPTGDGSVDIFDLIATSNIIANQPGTTPLANGGEYQRADTAPRSSKGDGSVDVQDLIQMGLYAAANNPLTPAGGPTVAAPPAMPVAVASKADTDQTGADRIDLDPVNTFINQPAAPAAGSATVSAGSVNSSAGSTAIVPIQLSSTNVGGVQFTVTYESAKLSIPSLVAVTDQATGTSFTFNNSTPGQLGVIAYRSTAGTAFPASTVLFNINFTVKAGAPAGASQIGFGITPVPLKASDPAAEAATIGTTNGAVTIVGSTAATVRVSGRVIAASGTRGISGVRLSLIDSQGNVRETISDKSGYYRFDDVEVGSSCVITATGKRYFFSQPSQVLNINEETEEVNFIANSEKRLRVF